MTGVATRPGLLRADHRLIGFRLVGWLLIALGQASWFVGWDTAGHVVGIVGVVIVAVGFERFVETHHRHG